MNTSARSDDVRAQVCGSVICVVLLTATTAQTQAPMVLGQAPATVDAQQGRATPAKNTIYGNDVIWCSQESPSIELIDLVERSTPILWFSPDEPLLPDGRKDPGPELPRGLPGDAKAIGRTAYYGLTAVSYRPGVPHAPIQASDTSLPTQGPLPHHTFLAPDRAHPELITRADGTTVTGYSLVPRRGDEFNFNYEAGYKFRIGGKQRFVTASIGVRFSGVNPIFNERLVASVGWGPGE